MNDSQSSDFLSQSTDMFGNSPPDPSLDRNMNTTTYDSMLANTKTAFCSVKKIIKKSSFSEYFSTLVEDCSTCITQSLSLITDLLSSTNINTNKLTSYMNDTVCLLQLLSDLVKNIIESVSMSCSTMKTFPTTTGRIICLVFTHCKDSESLYGGHLNKVEKQLKDLFRTCHELQLTYLLVVEKHFVFDLTDAQEQNILIEALHINLKIGEIVQSLDVKTMAEQWKAYTMICDKYSKHLLDKEVFHECSKILCAMVMNNIQTALEENQEDKIVLRSLKVSSFALKILTRVCCTFRHAVNKDYENSTNLMLNIHLNNPAYLQAIRKRSIQVINQYSTNITGAVTILLNELLLDQRFVKHFCYYDLTNLSDDKHLGYITLIISIIKAILKNGDLLKKQKHSLMSAVFSVLHYGHVWFNMGLMFDSNSIKHTYGLYEHLLAHTVALVKTMQSEDIQFVEQKMVESVLSADCCSAMFASNLWVVMGRTFLPNFLTSQVVSLCKMYQTLEQNNFFLQSPANIHLSYTIKSLFKILPDNKKIKVYNIFPIQDSNNMKLWKCITTKYLPNEIQFDAEQFVMEKFKEIVGDFVANGKRTDVNVLIDTIHLASTSSGLNIDTNIEDLIVRAWMKACPTNMQLNIQTLNKSNLWYYRYVEALANLTSYIANMFSENSASLVKILHIISSILHTGSQEFKLALIITLCKLAILEIYDGNKRFVDSILMESYRELFCDNNVTVKNLLYYVLRITRNNSLSRIISKVTAEENLHESWNHFLKYDRLKRDQHFELKDQLFFTLDIKYNHKCLENEELADSGSVKLQKSLSNNFDFVDIDDLFEAESDAEPACKKAKLNTSEVIDVISRIESDVSLLCKKENITSDYQIRLRNVINKLNTVID